MIFNTAVTVVANLKADTPEAAVKRLIDALQAAGFDAQADPMNLPTPDAFEAEDGTEPDTLPVPHRCLAPDPLYVR